MAKKLLFHFLLVWGCLAIGAPRVVDGMSIAFLGDSITRLGFDQETGFINLVSSGLEANGIKIRVIPAGISAHHSGHMRQRIENDVLRHEPQLLVLSCGLNDVWLEHRNQGVTLEAFSENVRAMVQMAEKAGVGVLLMTPTMIFEEPDNSWNLKLIPYISFLKDFAKEKNLVLVDQNHEFQTERERLKQLYPHALGNLLTTDGVHMSPIGDAVMARAILRALGLNADEIALAEKSWQDKFYLADRIIIPFKYFPKMIQEADRRRSGVFNVIDAIIADYFEGLD